MFTGIVQGLCEVTALADTTNLRRLSVNLADLATGIDLGASVAVNGTCLTVTKVSDGIVCFDVIKESLRLTNLGQLQSGDRVNVERSYRVGDEVGGHILSGHVSDCARLERIEEAPNRRDLFFRVEPRWFRYLHHKGFAAFDGASLTIAAVDEATSTVSVSLIPETIARTTLGIVQPGASVNLEVDAQTQAVVETVERVLGSPQWRARLARSEQPDD